MDQKTPDEQLDEVLNILKEHHSKSTKVVSWYADTYSTSVRGPFGRWLEVTEVNDSYKKNVASQSDDARYAASCMNSVPILIKVIERLQERCKKLEADLCIDQILREE